MYIDFAELEDTTLSEEEEEYLNKIKLLVKILAVFLYLQTL